MDVEEQREQRLLQTIQAAVQGEPWPQQLLCLREWLESGLLALARQARMQNLHLLRDPEPENPFRPHNNPAPFSVKLRQALLWAVWDPTFPWWSDDTFDVLLSLIMITVTIVMMVRQRQRHRQNRQNRNTQGKKLITFNHMK